MKAFRCTIIIFERMCVSADFAVMLHLSRNPIYTVVNWLELKIDALHVINFMEIIQASHIIILYQGCYSVLFLHRFYIRIFLRVLFT